jgi:leucyl-tRNA synthetase
LHRTIKKVGEDIESMSFNTAVSAMMIFMNEITSGESRVANGDWQLFVRLLSPFAPHIAEELWTMAGGKGLVSLTEFPKHDESLLLENTFELVVQVNSKVRGKIKMARGSTESQALTQIKSDPEIAKWLTGEIKKVIFIADRLINIIV